MKKYIMNTLMLLLSVTAALSCDKERMPEECAITVTGTASDIITNLPIKEIKLTMYALENGNYEKISIQTAYTDYDGRFIIEMSGFRSPTSFTIKAEDPNGVYGISTHEIPLVTWSSSYNISQGTFYVNECDFYMKKVNL